MAHIEGPTKVKDAGSTQSSRQFLTLPLMYKDTIIAILHHTLTYNKTESSFQIDVADSTISFEEALDIFFPG